jgi:hypothetical protein
MDRVQAAADAALLFDAHPQAAHVDIDGSLVAVEIETPDALQERLSRECGPRVLREREEQRELARFEAEILAVGTGFARSLIDFEAAEIQARGAGFRHSPCAA